MERPNESPSPSSAEAAAEDSESVADGNAEGFFERYFWALLLTSVVVAAGGGVGIAYLQYGWITQTASSIPFVSDVMTVAEEEKEAKKPGPGEYGSFTEMKGLIVNPAESDGTRYLAVSLAFETGSSAVVEEIETKKVVLRDAVLNLLSERTAAELSGPDRRDELKEALREKTNSLLSSGIVNRLYFTQYVLQ